MLNRIRHSAAALATAGLALTLALPARADRMAEIANDPASVPVIFDILVMRPIGLLATAVGTVFYVFPVAPVMAVTRPSEITKPLEALVGAPARFTFKDPIGHHPTVY
jgi:hypothetical protein